MISSFKTGFAFPALLLGGLLLAAGFAATRSTAEEARVIPPPAADEAASGGASEVAVVAGGCFWGVQGVFQHVDGVTRAVSGYAGGEKATAHYEMTSSGQTGHAESVQITYDPRKISYGRILQVYFSVAHDPTELNRQGPDSRHAVPLRHLPAERGTGESRESLYRATRFRPRVQGADRHHDRAGRTFYPAEDYHQDFLAHNPGYPYIVFNDLPKIANLKRVFPALYRPDPVLVGAKS